MYIAIAGNIGAGKTTLSTLLAREFNFETYLEDLTQNPYNTDFYNDMQRWAFHQQVYQINSRLRQILHLQTNNSNVVADRSIYEDVEIFMPNLLHMGLITQRDAETIESLFNTASRLLTPPDLLIFLKASVSTLVEHIEARGRDYEESIRIDYLRRLNERYDTWFAGYNKGKKLEVVVDELAFNENPEDLGKIVSRVRSELFGLF
jgi:deoxyadenosine/deoxycytidine kinase